MSTGPTPLSPWLRKVWLPNWKVPPSLMTVVGLRLPLFSAAMAMKGLKVEPGG